VNRRALLLALVLSVAWSAGSLGSGALAAAPGVRSSAAKTALRLGPGSVIRQQLVGVGRDVIVEGEALSDVAALDGSVEVTGRVAGDVVVLRGDVRLGPRARVEGNVFVLGGTVRVDPGAHTGGKMVSYPTASNAWLTLLEGPSLGLGFASRVVVGMKLALLAAWAALLLLLFAASGRQVMETAEGVRHEPFRSFFIGLTGVLALTLTALFFSALARGLIGVPMLILVVLFGILLKLWGMVAVFFALGDWLLRDVLHRRVRPLHAATLGLLVLGAAKFVPWFGVIAWTMATFIGVGASLSSKFGRREPWFDLA
jgi:hypothetical protein